LGIDGRSNPAFASQIVQTDLLKEQLLFFKLAGFPFQTLMILSLPLNTHILFHGKRGLSVPGSCK
jgi:hypothetical protein